MQCKISPNYVLTLFLYIPFHSRRQSKSSNISVADSRLESTSWKMQYSCEPSILSNYSFKRVRVACDIAVSCGLFELFISLECQYGFSRPFNVDRGKNAWMYTNGSDRHFHSVCALYSVYVSSWRFPVYGEQLAVQL